MSNDEAPRRRRWLRITLWVTGGLVILAALTLAVVQAIVRASLPDMSGEVEGAGVVERVLIERDELGVPTVTAQSRRDMAWTLGWLHGQERFFQMDLMRRASAGELAALFGEPALAFDRDRRRHRARVTAAAAIEAASPAHRAQIDAYAAGVNAGVTALSARPFEYLLLGLDPEPWTPTDTALVMLAMFFDLQDEDASRDRNRGVMAEALPPAVFEWIAPMGDARWDAAIDGSVLPAPPMPGPEVVDFRTMPAWAPLRSGGAAGVERQKAVRGSNSWAVAGSRSTHGGAIVADDMHLGLRLPAIWYRASLRWTGDDGGPRRLDGVTLPGGGPGIVAGSNGRIAWAFTNSNVDLTDAVRLELSDDGKSYRGPNGFEPFVEHVETIAVSGADPVQHTVKWTRWGPLVGEDTTRPAAARWVGHDPAALNMHIFDMQVADDLDAAVEIANGAGVPTQNAIIGDRTGRIGWTLMGMVPDRVGGMIPIDAATAGERPARLAASAYPRVLDPADGLLWTANARIVGGEMLDRVGSIGYSLGARQQQIRDALRAKAQHDETSLHAIQLDDRAVFLARWRDHVLALLEGESDPARAAFRRLVAETWTGRASPDSVAYRLVRAYRTAMSEAFYGALTVPCLTVDPGFVYAERMSEAALWQVVDTEPAHLLHPAMADWRTWKLAVVDAVIAELAEGEGDPAAALAKRTWGEANTTQIAHPLARAVPALRWLLAAPARAQHGDMHMPRVSEPSAGQSQRMVVSPGKEDRGIMVVPGGQSGHPLSNHYLDQFPTWLDGGTLPLLPGQSVHTLELLPAEK